MVTAIYAAIIGLMLTMLSFNVIKARRKFSTGLGDASNPEMARHIRAQANLAEYAPIFLILLGCSEMGGMSKWVLHLFGLFFVAGRIMHAYSLVKAEKYENFKFAEKPTWRIRGIKCTLLAIGLLSIIVLLQTLYTLQPVC